MATRTVYINYTLWLDSKEEVAALQARDARWNLERNDLGGALRVVTRWLFGVQGQRGAVYACPQRMLSEHAGMVIQKSGESMVGVYPPYITSPHIWSRNITINPNHKVDKDEYETCTGRIFGWCAPFISTRTKFIWMGQYAYAPPQTIVMPPGGGTPEPYQQVRWAEGFHLQPNPSGNAGGAANNFGHTSSPIAARTAGGRGLIWGNFTNGPLVRHSVREYRTDAAVSSAAGAGGASYKGAGASWERVYIKIVRLPTGTAQFYRFVGTYYGYGVALAITTLGQISVHNFSTLSESLIGTTAALPVGEWQKLDFMLMVGSNAKLIIYVNGVEAGTFYLGALSSFTPNPTAYEAHLTSELGQVAGPAAGDVGGTFYFADWVSYDHPLVILNANQDFLTGSKVVKLLPTSFGAGHDGTTWLTPVEQHQAEPALSLNPALNPASSSAAQPKFSVLTDAPAKITNDPLVYKQGITALLVSLYKKVALGGTKGKLGYAIDGAAFVDQDITDTPSANYIQSSVAYLPSGLTDPLPIATSIALRWTPGASAHARTIGTIGATAVVNGVFGQEDVNENANDPGEVVVPPRYNGLQNHPYPKSIWATATTPVVSPVIITQGTYVGGGNTPTVLTFEAPVTFFKVRRVTAATTDGVMWWPGMVAPAGGSKAQMASEGMISATWEPVDPPPALDADAPDGTCSLTIVGDNANSNESGSTYQYIAVMDPGGRLFRTGNFDSPAATNGLELTHPLYDDTFLPEACFLHKPSLAVAITSGLYYKGPGHAADAASLVTAAETASALEFDTGALISKQGMHYAPGGFAGTPTPTYIAIRSNDGLGETDALYAGVIQIFSYTGDGTASRTIQLRTSGRRPGWVFVQPHNGAAFVRDPSHTGTTSSVLGTNWGFTANASTGITAGGVDSISVGSLLNTNAVVYDVFVLMGCTVAGQNGWSENCTSVVLPPIEPPCIGENCEQPVECEDPTDEPPCGDCIGDTAEDCVECDPEVEDCGTEECDPAIEDCDTTVTTAPCDETGHVFGAQCVAASQRIVNIALSHIGISKAVTDIEDECTMEADQARLHYTDAVKECLREFPWAFATKYYSLVWVAGDEDTPVTGDWIYSFRLPLDCVFARRLVRESVGREFDRSQPKFRLGADATGNLLYTNFISEDATDDAPLVTLEYTHLMTCAAEAGDAIFRQALSWLLAHKLAPTLSRNGVTAADCWMMYLSTLNRASTVNAREMSVPRHDGDSNWTLDR